MITLVLSILSLTSVFAESLVIHSTRVQSIQTSIRTDHRPLTYKMANEILFTKLDNKNGIVCSVYKNDLCLTTNTVPSPKLMNIEHTWPQSAGANGDAKSDLHHIFVSDSPTNSIRSSLPFCQVETLKWTNGESKRGYNKFNEHCFEPPQNHKGNVARALFYFSLRYQMSIDENQEAFLRVWHLEDPVDQAEIDRNVEVSKFQGNLNPFINNPLLVNEISDF